jgi:mRNA interferase RelE/StbE
MKLLQTPTFQRKYKKLHRNQRLLVNTAIEEIIEYPSIGAQKKGDLGTIRVHKKRKGDTEFLIAYLTTKSSIELMDMGSHENFYRDLKRNLS